MYTSPVINVAGLFLWRTIMGMPKHMIQEKRYEMLKQVYMNNRTKRQTIDSKWYQYMALINKATYPHEMDEALDAIIENERRLKKNL